MDDTRFASSLNHPAHVFILSGPSGVGKNSVAEKVCDAGVATQAITATTRQPRPGEKDGEDYYFISRGKFETWLQNGNLLEYNEYVGNYYGTPAFSVNEATNDNKAALLVIDVNGALHIKRRFSEVNLIFLKPPDLETLEDRLRGRGDVDEENIRFRLQRAQEELKLMHKYDYTVVNDELVDAVEEVERIIQDNA